MPNPQENDAHLAYLGSLTDSGILWWHLAAAPTLKK